MKIASILCVTALAAALSVPLTTPSLADPGGDAAGAAIVGGVLGFMAGAATANGEDGPPPRPHYGPWHEHVRMCEDDYGWHYDPYADLVHWHGRVFRCDDWPDDGY